MKSLSKLDLKNKKYMIFDIDGTLIDSIGIWNLTDNIVLKELANIEVDLDYLQNIRENFIANNSDKDIYLEYCKFLINKYNLDISAKELLNLRWQISGNLLTNDVDYKEYAVDLLKLLKSLGYILVIASSTSQVQIDIYTKKNKKMMSSFNILDNFDYIVKKDDIDRQKPNPDIYLHILDYYNAKREECLVFEDSLIGVMAAKNANIDVICIKDKYSNNDRDKIEEITDYEIDSFDEVIKLLKVR